MSRRLVQAAGALVVAWLLLPAEVLGCAVCYGDPDSGQVIGLNRAIWAMLAVVAVVQAGFVGMFVGFLRRARRAGDGDNASEASKGVAE